jgi:hypothetical protein
MTGPLTPTDCVSAFIKRLTALDREKSPYDKFRDFCEMAFCAYAKLTAPTPERAQELEDRYMQIVGTYRDKDTVRAYPELVALAGSAIPQGCDFLGSVATELEVLNAQIGQFFTPYDVARMMAMMSLEGAADMIAANGYLTLQEPASGAGGMVLAAADALVQQGFHPGLHMLVNAIDLSPLCFHMTFLQLTLRGIPALVEHGNTLSGERFARAWTPAATAFHLHHGRLFPEVPLPAAHERIADEEPATVFGEQLVLL